MLVKKRKDILKLIPTDRQWLFLVSRIINLALGESIKYSVQLVSPQRGSLFKNNLQDHVALISCLDFILTSQEHVASSLRLIEVYTDVKSYSTDGQIIVNKIYNYLISQDYYEKVRALADARSASEPYLTKQNRFSFVMIRSKKHT